MSPDPQQYVADSAEARSSGEDAYRWWPVRRSDEPLPRRKSPPQATRRSGVVLIADDSHDARQMYGEYLSHAGFGIFTAHDGAAALNIAIQVQPDVIVMDLSMPTLDGITATQRLRQHPRTRQTPVILLTGYPRRAIERGALESGVSVFLTKPCLPEDLEAHIRRLLPGKSP
jgi:two-component system, OmpR family, alkaline phosphatase synthesis response regulator PhoP